MLAMNSTFIERSFHAVIRLQGHSRCDIGQRPGRRATEPRHRSEPVWHTAVARGRNRRIRQGGFVGSVILNLMVQYSPSVDRAFTALADPTRRAVLERLGFGSATVSELAEPFGMSLTGMKKHLTLLEEAELVTTEKVGRVRRCMLAPYAFEGITTWLQRLDRFAQVVERTKGTR
jgi:DNA-binding transcriptional ArsR family regulator